MRLPALFYTFLIIFVVTSTVTLLGVLGIVPIREAYLNALLGAFLIELAGAVVALFKRTDFFAAKDPAVSASLADAVDTFDRLSDEIEAAIKNQPPPSANRPHQFIIRRFGNDIVAYRQVQSISKDRFDKLPSRTQREIGTYEKSMNTLKKEWDNIKRENPMSQLDPRIRERQVALIKIMKDDLVGIVNTLETAGFYLDDHYKEVRDLVSKL
jgi:hypothetical protein